MTEANPRFRSLLDFGPQPLDRLGILTILASLYFIQLHSHLLLRLDLDPFGLRNLAAFALLASCLVGILFARHYPILLVNAGVFFAAYLWRMPVESNNQTLAMFFSATVLAAAACQLIGWRRGQWDLDRDTLFELIAGPGRWLLAILYFYGIYHKINADFLDPTVSCGTLLYQLLVAKAEGGLRALTGWAPDLVGWPVGQYGAIWGTFIVEGLAMVLLFSSRYKKLGFIIGVPFHILIGWTGYAYYIDFSTIALVAYALFLPREATDGAEARLARLFGSAMRARAICRAAALVLLVCFAFYAGVFQDWRLLRTAQVSFVWLFSAYALVFYAFAIVFVPWRATSGIPLFRFRPQVLILIPMLYFLNGASPYLGLKTESTVSMFSNLHTEGGADESSHARSASHRGRLPERSRLPHRRERSRHYPVRVRPAARTRRAGTKDDPVRGRAADRRRQLAQQLSRGPVVGAEVPDLQAGRLRAPESLLALRLRPDRLAAKSDTRAPRCHETASRARPWSILLSAA
jgi:hypothetical protein